MFGFLKKKDKEELSAPVNGEVIAIDQVADPVFSQKMMGDGFGVEPTDGVIYAPVEGTVESVFPTKHAITLKTKNGVDILVHMGIDTVELQGEGFEILVKEGQKVTPSDRLATIDLPFLASKDKKATIIVVLPDFQGEFALDTTGNVEAQQVVGSVK